MKFTSLWSIASLALLLGLAGCQTPTSTPPPGARPAGEPANLLPHKAELNAYIDDGRYDEGIARVAALAKNWIEQRTARDGEKLAIVLDIDETVLSNLKHMREMDFGYVPKLWDQWVADADAPAIESMREVYRAARARKIAVFYLTGRKTTDQPGTERNLRATGLGGYTRIYYKPVGYPQTTEHFKTATRREITEQGYTIIANIGDQASDLAGGYAEKTFKLPNPFYLTK